MRRNREILVARIGAKAFNRLSAQHLVIFPTAGSFQEAARGIGGFTDARIGKRLFPAGKRHRDTLNRLRFIRTRAKPLGFRASRIGCRFTKGRLIKAVIHRDFNGQGRDTVLVIHGRFTAVDVFQVGANAWRWRNQTVRVTEFTGGVIVKRFAVIDRGTRFATLNHFVLPAVAINGIGVDIAGFGALGANRFQRLARLRRNALGENKKSHHCNHSGN